MTAAAEAGNTISLSLTPVAVSPGGVPEDIVTAYGVSDAKEYGLPIINLHDFEVPCASNEAQEQRLADESQAGKRARDGESLIEGGGSSDFPPGRYSQSADLDFYLPFGSPYGATDYKAVLVCAYLYNDGSNESAPPAAFAQLLVCQPLYKLTAGRCTPGPSRESKAVLMWYGAETYPRLPAYIEVAVTPAWGGRVALLQEEIGSGWETISRTVTNERGQGSFVAHFASAGKYHLRALVLASIGFQATLSAPITVVVINYG
jgi:hypothetical protein